MFNIGDLICYNAAGQRKKSLGLIINRHIRTDNGKVKGVDVFYQIQWARRPDICPRSEWSDPRAKYNRDYDLSMYATEKTNWYQAGDWFEVIEKK